MGCIPQSLLMLIMSLLVTFGLWTGVTVPVPGAALPAESCTIITDQADVPVRVGPGEQRAVRVFLPTGAPIPVVGQAAAGDGSRWWQVDLAGIEQAWVAQADVTSTGGCASVPAADAPAIVIAPPSAPDSPGGDPAGDDMGGASPADGIPDEASVEIACVVDSAGAHPIRFGEIPLQKDRVGQPDHGGVMALIQRPECFGVATASGFNNLSLGGTFQGSIDL